jgi:lycopene cyclase CruA
VGKLSFFMTVDGIKSQHRRAAPDLADFRRRYPLTVANFGALGNREAWLRQIWEMDARWRHQMTPWGGRQPVEEVIVETAPPERMAIEAEFEIIYAGGTLGLLHAATMAACYGRKVMVFDAQAVGRTGRDLNLSGEDLSAFEGAGLFTKEETEGTVVNRYHSGFVKFHDAASRVKTPPLWMNGVLDVALDADKLLGLAASKIKSSGTGSALIEGQRLVRVYVEPHRVTVETEDARNKRRRLFQARLFVDATGAESRVARQLNSHQAITHVCPTVGTVARGFMAGREPEKVDFRVGEILVSNEDASDHRQLIWEGFAGDPSRDEYTTCLFFFDAVDSPADKSLLALFERYFETISTYKRTGAQWRVKRPIFGFLPSSQQRGMTTERVTAARRVMLMGDMAGVITSPLAFGFGSFVRNLKRLTHLTDLALNADMLDAASLREVSMDEPRVAQVSSLAEFLRPTPRSAPSTVNETLNAVMAALHDLDEHVRREMFQDRMTWTTLKNLLSRTAKLYPRIFQRMREHLGARGTFWWLTQIASVVLQERRGAHHPQFLESSAPGDDNATEEFARFVRLYKSQQGASGF